MQLLTFLGKSEELLKIINKGSSNYNQLLMLCQLYSEVKNLQKDYDNQHTVFMQLLKLVLTKKNTLTNCLSAINYFTFDLGLLDPT